MKLKKLLQEIDVQEKVQICNEEFVPLTEIVKLNCKNTNKDFKNFEESEVKCFFSNKIERKEDFIETYTCISVYYKDYEYLTDNSFRYKENVYSFYHLKEATNIVVFFKDNGEEVQTFINWFYITQNDDYEYIVKRCIDYIKNKEK